MKLGAIPSVPDGRDRLFGAYLSPAMHPAPLLRDWTTGRNGTKVAFSAFGNLEFGCCTCAALGHVDQAAAAHTGRLSVVTEGKVLDAYDAISDWDRSTPTENDDGAQCRNALKYFKAAGIIELYARVSETNRRHLEIAVNLGGAAYVGADLPLAAQRQAVWDVAPANGWTDAYTRRSWGGHAMALLGYDHEGVWFATWGRTQRATWPWVLTYLSEAWIAISDLWTDVGKLTPSGFDIGG